jgi:hypothetical protein
MPFVSPVLLMLVALFFAVRNFMPQAKIYQAAFATVTKR